MANQITLSTLHNTIQSIHDLSKVNLDNILAFNNNKLTSKTAKQYIDIMNELHEKIETLEASVEQKNQFRSLFVLLFSKMCESDCKGIMLSNSIQKNKKYKEIIDKLQEAYQKEREHNALQRNIMKNKKKQKLVFQEYHYL
jgi:molecular chaperone DnaK (HSP70)